MKSEKKITAVLLAVLLLAQFLPVFGEELEFHEVIDLRSLLSLDSQESSTVQFVDWDGTVLEEKPAERGTHAAYTGSPPTRDGYTFTGWYPDPSEVVVQEDVSENRYTAQYVSETLHVLNIYYVFAADGSMAAHTYVATLPYGKSYSITSPEVVGFVPDQEVVTGTIDRDTPEAITVTYTAGEGTPYLVHYYVQKLGVELSGGDDHDLHKYDPHHSETDHATTNSFVTLDPEPIEGFTLMEEESRTYQIAADGSTEINVFYTRDTYAILFSSDGGSYVEPIIAQYEAAITAPGDPTKKGYAFAGWDKPLPAQMPAGGDTLTAKWTQANSTYMVHLWIENANDTDYTYYNTIVENGITGDTIDTSGFAERYKLLDGYAYAKYFTYKGCDADGNTVVIAGDGSTAVNAYFSRNVYTVSFKLKGAAQNSPIAAMEIGGTTYEIGGVLYSISAKFNANISGVWPYSTYVTVEKPEEYVFSAWGIYSPTEYAWVYYGDETFTMWSDLCVEGGMTLVFEWDRVSSVYAVETHHTYYENVNGYGEPLPADVAQYVTLSADSSGLYDDVGILTKYANPYYGQIGMSYYFHIEINGMKPVYSNLNNQSNRAVGIPSELDDGLWMKSDIYFIYDRMTYTLDFINGDDLYASVQVKFSEWMSPHEITELMPPDGVSPNAQFAGWYTTKGLVDGTEYIFKGKTMLADNLVLYAKWTPPAYPVRYFEDEGATSSVHSETVTEGEHACDAPDISGARPGYRFLGWFEEDSIVPYQFTDQAITGDLNLYAHWMQRTDLAYEVYYWDTGTDALLSAQTVGGQNPKVVEDQRMETTVTEHAPVVSGYVPDVVSKSIIVEATQEKPDGSGVINFYYTPYETLKYKVQYIDRDTGEPVHEETDWITTTEAIVTVRWENVPGYTPETREIDRQLVYDSEENVIVFYYRSNPQAPYAVEHYLMDPATGTYPTDYAYKEDASGPYGMKVQATEWAEVPSGYAWNSAISTTTGYIASNGSLVLKLYYRLRDDVPYEVKHYLQDEHGGEAYTLDGTDNLSGTTGTTATYTVRDYEVHMYESSKTTPSDPKVLGDGALVIELYYNVKDIFGLTVMKTVTNEGSGTNGAFVEGDTIEYEVIVENTGNVTLTNIVVNDSLVELDDNEILSLAPGARATFTYEYVVTAADAAAGGVTNTATATADEVPTEIPDEIETPIAYDPGLTVTKTVTNEGSGTNGAFVEGDTIEYEVIVENTGNVTLTNIVVNDSLVELDDNEILSLTPGARATFTYEYVVTAADAAAGGVTNTATATADEVPLETDEVETEIEIPKVPTTTPTPTTDRTTTPTSIPTSPPTPTQTPAPTRTLTPAATTTPTPAMTPAPTPIPGIDLDDPYIAVPEKLDLPPIRIGDVLYEIGDNDVPLGGIGGRNVGDCPN